jgi:long-subunit fatty acid transport protein
LLDENRVIRQDYRETIQYNLGGELFVPGLKMMLRGGYALYPSPLKNAAEDLDKQYYTAGVGFLIDRYVSLDFTYLRGIWKQESIVEFTPGGTLEEITSNKVLIGMTYRF